MSPLKKGVAGVRIRMHNVGFGDAFLLWIPAPDRPRKVLIDCGAHISGAHPMQIGAAVDAIVAAAAEGEKSGPRIDVVVATHRHRDHVSGFEKEAWKQVDVGEVWMPWTEDYDDPDGSRIRDAQSKAAKHIEARLALRAKLRAAGSDEGRTQALLELSQNQLVNAEAMNTLHRGFRRGLQVRRRFLPERKKSVRSFTTDLLPGVRVHVLGPPRDADAIALMEPPLASSYRPKVDEDGLSQDPPLRPFPGFASTDRARLCEQFGIKESVLRMVDQIDEEDELFAAALDGAVNNTSLMLVFEIGSAVFVFPGDAQWGCWKPLLADGNAMALLGRASFLKVGHHGSENATPREVVAGLPDGSVPAMISAARIDRFPRVPEDNLVRALAKKGFMVARTDQTKAAGKPFSWVLGGLACELVVPI